MEREVRKRQKRGSFWGILHDRIRESTVVENNNGGLCTMEIYWTTR